MPLTIEEKRARRTAYNKRHYQEHRLEIRAKAKIKSQSPEFKAKNRERAQRHRDRYPSSYIEYKVALQEAEAGRPKTDYCEICGNTKQRIMFDHCHQRGVFRGWICISCNSILGHANDDPKRLRMAIAYLERTKDLVSPQLELPV